MDTSKNLKNVTKNEIGGAYFNQKTKPRLMILPKQKSRKDGLCKVYIELSVTQKSEQNSKRKFKRVATSVRVAPEQWSIAKEEVKPSHPEHILLNRKLKESLNAVDGYVNTKIDGKAYSQPLPTELKTFEKYFDLKHRKTLISYLDDYINYRQLNSVRNTWKEFRTLKGRLERYQEHVNKILFFESIDFDFAESLKAWGKSIKLNPNTLKKTFDALGTFLNHFYNDQFKLNFYLKADFREKKFIKVSGTHTPDPSPLYGDEIKKLIAFKPTKPITYVNRKGEEKQLTLNGQYRIKNLFLLACCCGLRFSDLTSLKKANFIDDSIRIRASKTDNKKESNTLSIPILDVARNILNEIDYDITKIKLSNQKSNDYLTIVLKHIGVDTPTIDYEYSANGERKEKEVAKYDVVTFHSSRDTFITNMLIAGVDIPTIMSWTGHNKFETFKKYIRLSEQYLKTQHKKVINVFGEPVKRIE